MFTRKMHAFRTVTFLVEGKKFSFFFVQTTFAMLKPDIAEKEDFNVEGITVVQSKAKCKHCDEIPLPVRKKEGGKRKTREREKRKIMRLKSYQGFGYQSALSRIGVTYYFFKSPNMINLFDTS